MGAQPNAASAQGATCETNSAGKPRKGALGLDIGLVAIRGGSAAAWRIGIEKPAADGRLGGPSAPASILALGRNRNCDSDHSCSTITDCLIVIPIGNHDAPTIGGKRPALPRRNLVHYQTRCRHSTALHLGKSCRSQTYREVLLAQQRIISISIPLKSRQAPPGLVMRQRAQIAPNARTRLFCRQATCVLYATAPSRPTIRFPTARENR